MTAPRHASAAGSPRPVSDVPAAEPEAPSGRRVGALVLVLAVAVAGGLAGGLAGRTPPSTSLRSSALVAQAAPLGSQSSSWYCTGASGISGPLGQSQVLLVNAGAHPVSATVDVATTKGKTAQRVVRVPARGQLGVAPATMVDGPWLATRIDVAGGGVSASEMVNGSAGGAVAPCASETSPTWYFATGATTAGNTLRMSVFNPTANLAVVDMSFLTSAGTTNPQPFQGLVLEPGAVRSVTVGQYVQDHKQVAAQVTARSGSVVATEVQTVQAGGVAGVALRLGAPAPADTWVVPRAVNVSGGTSQVSVFNPTKQTETVSVRAQLSAGPVAPFTDKLGPGSVWTLDTAEEVRIPDAQDYAVVVRVSGGPGVVVDRTATGAAGSGTVPWGDDPPVALASAQAGRWVVPAVDEPGTITVASRQLVLADPGRRPVSALVSTLTSAGVRRVTRVTVDARSFATAGSGSQVFLVTADGPLAVVGDASPAAAPATVLVPAIPQS